ncbi:MAG: taurine dioxygenase [Rhodospirillaceae bacterium]|nr:taurine dioxygenase [Magnetovibrio sp.]MAY66260.1 taurine dioxygenase [Rhodospirillaceae bacterium]
MQLRTRPLTDTFGLEILDVDLSDLNDETFDAIYKLWQQEPLLLLRRQSLSESEQVAYSRRFGEMDIIVRDDMLSPDNPEVIYITNLKRPDGTPLGGLGNYEVYWHHDQIYRLRPASGSIFYAAEMPENEGSTSYCNTRLGYETLPDNLRKAIEGRRATAKYADRKDSTTILDLGDNAEEMKKIHARTPAATHDIVLENPATGQKSLYIDPNKTVAIDGLEEAESKELLEALTQHMLQDKFVYTHSWRNGDVVMWDNARLWHRREAFDMSKPRFARRTTIFLRPEDFAVPEPNAA